MNIAAVMAFFVASVTSTGTTPHQFNGISGCRTTKLDLVFVIDGSSREFQYNYKYVRRWIQNITSNFDVSPYATRVAVVQKDDAPYTEFGFRDFSSTDEVIQAANNLQFGTGAATTADILRYTEDNVVNSARPEASIVVLFLSDGEITSPEDVYVEATRLHQIGISTFAIGTGEIAVGLQNLKYLKSIASDSKDHVFAVQHLQNVGTLTWPIISEVCKHTVQECPTASHDLAFIIDGSSTIGYQNFEKIKSWMKKIVEAFDVGANKTRIAIIQYSTSVQEEISFNDRLSKVEVLEKISQMRLLIGDTHTGHALEYCMKYIFSDSYGSRNNIPDVVIVMTDGKAQDHKHVVHAAKEVHDAGIEVYAMGVGDDYSLEEIRDIASEPKENHILQASSFEELDFQRTGLIKRICKESEPGCPNTVADIVFLVDNQVMTGDDNMQNVQAWVKSAVDYLEVGEHYSRIGLVRYGALPELLFDLRKHSSTSDVINAITRHLRNDGINPNEKSAAGIAIDYAKAAIFGRSKRKAPRFLVMLSNGESSDDFAPAVRRAKNVGIEIFSFGVGEVNVPNIEAMASSPEYVFHEKNFHDIRRRLGSFVSALCEISEPACVIQEIDLQFLVDASDNIRPSDFEKVKRWITNVIRSFDIGNYTTRVGLAKYSSKIKNIFDMGTYKTKREIEHAVDTMTLMRGSTYSGRALEHVMTHSFTTDAGSRNGASKVLVVLSDGNSRDSIDEAVMKIHQDGIRVFAVGAGNSTERSFLGTLATEPIVTHVTESTSYDAINTVRQQVVDEICRETNSECPEVEMDLIFLVEGSTAIEHENFLAVKRWLMSFVSQFEIGEYNSQIGLVQYASTPRLEINLKKVSDKETLMRAIANVRHLTGASKVGAALKYVREQGFSMKSNRRNTPKVVIVLTSGSSNDVYSRPASQLMSDGVIMYAVGVGDVRPGDLRSLASSDDNVLHVRNVDSIQTIQSSLVRRVCQDVQIDCRENATDIVILIDGSYSVGYDDWEIVKSFMLNLTDKFEIGPKGVQLGVVQYATEPRIEFTLRQHDSWYGLQRAIRGIEWMKGDTHTAKALRFARLHAMTRAAGARPNVAKILMIVTDGEPQDSNEVEIAAAAILSDGWRIFAIGVDKASMPELHVLASKPEKDHVFYADDFESTRKLKGRLFRMICTERPEEAARPTTEDPNFDFVLSLSNQRRTTPRPNDTSTDANSEEQLDVLPTTNNGNLKGTTQEEDLLADATRFNKDDGFASFPIGRGTLDTKEAAVVKVDPEKIIDSRSAIDFNTAAVTPEFSPPGNLVAAGCPKIERIDKRVTKGIDYLKEMGIIQTKASGKPKRSALVNRDAGSPDRRLAIKIKPGSLDNLISYRVTANSKEPRLLSTALANVFGAESWSFVSVFRLHGVTVRGQWTLLNITDENGKNVFTVNFSGADRSATVAVLREDGLKTVEVHEESAEKIFDRKFHKLEVMVDNSQISVKVDCVTVQKIELNASAPEVTSLTGTWVTSSADSVTVNIQEMLFKCDFAEKEWCCEIPGGQCGFKSLEVEEKLFANDSSACLCPPGPQGPPGRPGKVLKRGMNGKPGPRGHPGKTPPVNKAVIRHVAKKVAAAMIQDEMRKMYKVILNSITDEGRVNRKVIEAVLTRYERGPQATKSRAQNGKSVPPTTGDCRGRPCDAVPDEILGQLD